jgi:predicted Zn-dependent protease
MKKLYALFFSALLFTNCNDGKLALIPNSMLFSMAEEQYKEFLSENEIVHINCTSHAHCRRYGRDAEMLERVGQRIAVAAQKLLEHEGKRNNLRDYNWEFTLVYNNTVNAWVMPGGKIVFYTGILPITANEDGAAVVMGHEAAHAIRNHGQQRVSLALLQQFGSITLALATANQSPEFQDILLTSFGIGSTLFGTLPFSRENEREADRDGLLLMAIAGYNPDEGARLWERMGRGSTPEFLSTHPDPGNRVRDLRNYAPTARQRAQEIGIISF